MASKRKKDQPKAKRPAGAKPEDRAKVVGSPAQTPPALPYRPGVEPGRVDITGLAPAEIRIDPDITEGHPGYDESGDSEIIPPERLSESASASANEPT